MAIGEEKDAIRAEIVQCIAAIRTAALNIGLDHEMFDTFWVTEKEQQLGLISASEALDRKTEIEKLTGRIQMV